MAAPFRKSDIARAVKAVQGVGIDIARIEIDKDGKIIIVTTTPGTPSGDEIDKEIEDFKRRRRHGNRES